MVGKDAHGPNVAPVFRQNRGKIDAHPPAPQAR
jgi:hypothetical protein